MNTEQEMRCCPFCGTWNKLKVTPYRADDDGGEPFDWGFTVICSALGFLHAPNRGCGASGAWGETEAEAIAAWNRRSSDEQAEVVACPDCGGNGHIAVDVSHPECCGQFGKSGECCGNAVEGRHQEAMPCQRCLGLGWLTASPPAVAAGGVTGLLAEIDDILDEDAPNKWVWKTHASLGEWCRDKLLPVIRKTRAALAVRDEGIREGWQPIETAPKDGTEVLLWGVCWRDHQAYAPDRNVGWWAGDHLGWQTRGQDEDIDPTHWRPLPTPPSRGEGE